LLFDIYSRNYDINSNEFGKDTDHTDKVDKNRKGVGKINVKVKSKCHMSQTLECGYHRTMKDRNRYDPVSNPDKDLTRMEAVPVGP